MMARFPLYLGFMISGRQPAGLSVVNDSLGVGPEASVLQQVGICKRLANTWPLTTEPSKLELSFSAHKVIGLSSENPGIRFCPINRLWKIFQSEYDENLKPSEPTMPCRQPSAPLGWVAGCSTWLTAREIPVLMTLTPGQVFPSATGEPVGWVYSILNEKERRKLRAA